MSQINTHWLAPHNALHAAKYAVTNKQGWLPACKQAALHQLATACSIAGLWHPLAPLQAARSGGCCWAFSSRNRQIAPFCHPQPQIHHYLPCLPALWVSALLLLLAFSGHVEGGRASHHLLVWWCFSFLWFLFASRDGLWWTCPPRGPLLMESFIGPARPTTFLLPRSSAIM